MFGIGMWELIILCGCCAVPVIIGTVVAVVLLATNRGPDDR
jgi:hypothetical protein